MPEVNQHISQRIPIAGSPFRAHSIDLSLYSIKQTRQEFGQFLDCLEEKLASLQRELTTSKHGIVLGMLKIWDATTGQRLAFYDSGADLPLDGRREEAVSEFIGDLRAQLTEARSRFTEDSGLVSYLVDIYPRRLA